MLCAAVVVATALGCETTPPEVQDPALVTGGDSFELRDTVFVGYTWYETTIPYTFTNRTGSKVYLPNCRGDFRITLEVYEGGEWVHYWSSPGLLVHETADVCPSSPIVIEPGEVYPGTLHVRACTLGGGCAPRRTVTLPGTDSTQYRIVWTDALSSYDKETFSGDLIPLEERVSNHFTLVVAEPSH